MPKTIINQFAGLVTMGNASSMPSGAMRRANNVVIRRGCIEHRRSHKQYSTSAPVDSSEVLFFYSGTLYLVAASTLYKDVAGAFVTSLGTIASGMSGAILTLRPIEASGNCYLNGSTGVKKLDSTTATALASAGVPRALDLALSSATGSTVFSATGQIAGYRVCYGIQDANTNLIVGPPSGRATFTSTAAQDVTVRSDIPKEIWNATNATSYFYRIFRTSVDTTGADPGDECRLVFQAKLTATDVANKFISVTDRQPDSALQDYLYTNPSQEKIAQANYAPPICQDLALFAGCGFYANTTSKHRSRLVMLGIPEEMAIQSIAANTPIVGRSTYTFAAPVDTTGLTTAMFLSVTGSTAAANDGTWQVVSSTATTVVVQNAGVNQAGIAGTAITGLIAVDGTSYFPVYTAESSANKQFTIPTTGTQSQRITSTALSLCRMVNRQHTTVYAYYESGPQDGPGRILFEEQSIGGASFNVTAASTTTAAYANAYYNRFAPTIASGTPLTSSNDRAKNRLYVSKYGQPEHVPLGDTNYFDIGAKTANIVRITPLREALLIWKEDGLFRLTGTAAQFTVTKFDETVILTARTAAATMRNKTYALCTRGLVEADAVSARLISKPVTNLATNYYTTLLPILSVNEREGMVYVYLNDDTETDIQSLLFNRESEAGTFTSGTSTLYSNPAWAYDSAAGKIYRGSSSGPVFMENIQESLLTGSPNAMFDVIDPGDSSNGTISSVSIGTSQITLSAGTAAIGDVIRWGAVAFPRQYALVTATASAGTVLTVSLLSPVGGTLTLTTGAVQIITGGAADIEFHPKAASDPSAPQILDGVIFCFENIHERLYDSVRSTVVVYPDISSAAVSFRSEYATTLFSQSSLPVAARFLEVMAPTAVADVRTASVRFQHTTPAERFSIGAVVYSWNSEEDSTAAE